MNRNMLFSIIDRKRKATTDDNMEDHVYYNEGGESATSVTSPRRVDEDGCITPVNQQRRLPENTANPEQQYESLEPVSPQPTGPMSDNTYQTLTVDTQDYVIVR